MVRCCSRCLLLSVRTSRAVANSCSDGTRGSGAALDRRGDASAGAPHAAASSSAAELERRRRARVFIGRERWRFCLAPSSSRTNEQGPPANEGCGTRPARGPPLTHWHTSWRYNAAPILLRQGRWAAAQLRAHDRRVRLALLPLFVGYAAAVRRMLSSTRGVPLTQAGCTAWTPLDASGDATIPRQQYRDAPRLAALTSDERWLRSRQSPVSAHRRARRAKRACVACRVLTRACSALVLAATRRR